MSEMAPIPADSQRANAKGLLRLRHDALVLSGAKASAVEARGINPQDPRSVEDMQFALQYPQTRAINGIDQFTGVFDGIGQEKKLVGAIEVRPFNLIDLYPFLLPNEKLSFSLSHKYRSGILRNHSLGISALVAQEATDSSRSTSQTDILAGLLRHVTTQTVDTTGSIYVKLPYADPAREVVMDDGFRPINDRSVKRFGVPFTLFARHSDQ